MLSIGRVWGHAHKKKFEMLGPPRLSNRRGNIRPRTAFPPDRIGFGGKIECLKLSPSKPL